MNIMTSDGIEIYVLPDCAKCELSGKSPEQMDECPIRYKTGFEDCMPGECPYYTENEGE